VATGRGGKSKRNATAQPRAAAAIEKIANDSRPIGDVAGCVTPATSRRFRSSTRVIRTKQNDRRSPITPRGRPAGPTAAIGSIVGPAGSHQPGVPFDVYVRSDLKGADFVRADGKPSGRGRPINGRRPSG
jgi:hypothetical protein